MTFRLGNAFLGFKLFFAFITFLPFDACSALDGAIFALNLSSIVDAFLDAQPFGSAPHSRAPLHWWLSISCTGHLHLTMLLDGWPPVSNNNHHQSTDLRPSVGQAIQSTSTLPILKLSFNRNPLLSAFLICVRKEVLSAPPLQYPWEAPSL